MMTHDRRFATQRATVAVAMLVLAAFAPDAYADDPLAQIKNTVLKDRDKACVHAAGGGLTFGSDKDFQYDKRLEDIAQAYARDEKKPQTPPVGFQNILPFLGAGDPEAQAINRAYQHGAGSAIGNCSFEGARFGVGFTRHADRSVDVATIVIGFLNPPPPPQPPNDHCKSLGADWMKHAECQPPQVK